jgi:hypothetical protein
VVNLVGDLPPRPPVVVTGALLNHVPKDLGTPGDGEWRYEFDPVAPARVKPLVSQALQERARQRVRDGANERLVERLASLGRDRPHINDGALARVRVVEHERLGLIAGLVLNTLW